MHPHPLFQVEPRVEHCLDEEGLEFARNESVDCGVPVVFMANGRPVDIVTGQLQESNTPQLAQICYFNFSMETAQLIAKATKTLPVFRAVQH